MSGQGAHKLASGRVPHLYGPIPRRRHNVATIKVDHIHRRSVAYQSSFYFYVLRRVHVPHNDLSVFGTGYHEAVHEAQVEHCLFVVVQCLHVLARFDVPHADRGVAGAAHNDVLVVLQAEHTARVAAQRLAAFKLLLVPNFDRVVAQATYDLLIVVLQTVNALAVLRATHYLFFHTFALGPVLVHLLSIIKYFLLKYQVKIFRYLICSKILSKNYE